MTNFTNTPVTPAKFHKFGGQLSALSASLCNPLEQQTTILMIGDSITWGLDLPGNAVQTPRSHQMSDARDNYGTGSYVDIFKAWIGSIYFGNVTPTLSNWIDSPSGQSTASFSKTVNLYTNMLPFSTPVFVGSANNGETVTPGTLCGMRQLLGVANSSSSAEISFQFTGSALKVFYTSIVASSCDYVLTVDGTVVGTYTTDTGSNSNGNSRSHTFPYVRNKTVKIKAVYHTGNTGVNYLYLEGVQVNKTCTIVNQGIIGTDAREYNANNFGAYGHTVATPDTNYAFIMLGTNDRVNTFPSYGQPNSPNNLARNLKTLMASLTSGCSPSVVLMCAEPVVNEDTATYAYTMQDVRSTVLGLGLSTSTDVIDNYAIYEGYELDVVLADGLHPNSLGHALMAQNIINSIEAA